MPHSGERSTSKRDAHPKVKKPAKDWIDTVQYRPDQHGGLLKLRIPQEANAAARLKLAAALLVSRHA